MLRLELEQSLERVGRFCKSNHLEQPTVTSSLHNRHSSF